MLSCNLRSNQAKQSLLIKLELVILLHCISSMR